MSEIGRLNPTDDNLVTAVVLAPQDSEAWAALVSRFEPRLIRWLNRHHYYLSPRMDTILPEDEDANPRRFVDILQETWLAAFTNLQKFDANRGTFYPWLHGLCRNAVKMVRRQYGIPDPVLDNSIGAASEEDAPVRRYDLSLESVVEPNDLDADGPKLIEPKLHPDWIREHALENLGNSFDRILADDQAEWILQSADASGSPMVAQALLMVAVEKYSLNQAASRLGVHRKTLTRHIRNWVLTEQLESVLVLVD